MQVTITIPDDALAAVKEQFGIKLEDLNGCKLQLCCVDEEMMEVTLSIADKKHPLSDYFLLTLSGNF